jgi:hypothetical protein
MHFKDWTLLSAAHSALHFVRIVSMLVQRITSKLLADF